MLPSLGLGADLSAIYALIFSLFTYAFIRVGEKALMAKFEDKPHRCFAPRSHTQAAVLLVLLGYTTWCAYSVLYPFDFNLYGSVLLTSFILTLSVAISNCILILVEFRPWYRELFSSNQRQYL
jgi:hypothetical protein